MRKINDKKLQEMIKEIFTKNKFTMVAALVFVLAICTLAQRESFRVGETVETNDGRVCKILTITGRSAKVACSDLRVYSFDALTSERKAQAKRARAALCVRASCGKTSRPKTYTLTAER